MLEIVVPYVVDVYVGFVNLIPVTMVQSLVYALIATGIMIPFRILNFPDLTSEGSFPLGGAICAALLAVGVDPFLAVIAAMAGGFGAGCTTAYFHLKFKINTLLAGILVLTMSFSVIIRVMGRSNVALFEFDNILKLIHPAIETSVGAQIAVYASLIVAVVLVLLWFFNTEIGISMRAVGANLNMASAQGINTWSYTVVGLGLANMLNGTAGAIMVQQQGYADVNMGLGILIDGLAALIIGETITGRTKVWRQVAAPVVGSIVYYQLISLGLSLGLAPSDLKFVTGVFVLLALGLPALRGQAVAETLKIRE